MLFLKVDYSLVSVSLAVPRVSAFQAKEKSRARKPNNATNALGKTKNNHVDKKPSKQQLAKVDLFKTKADEKDNTVTLPASPLKDPVGSSIMSPFLQQRTQLRKYRF